LISIFSATENVTASRSKPDIFDITFIVLKQ
jgi:hypothetical protein